MEPVQQAIMPWRQQLKAWAWLEMPLVQRSLIALILVNAVILGPKHSRVGTRCKEDRMNC